MGLSTLAIAPDIDWEKVEHEHGNGQDAMQPYVQQTQHRFRVTHDLNAEFNLISCVMYTNFLKLLSEIYLLGVDDDSTCLQEF